MKIGIMLRPYGVQQKLDEVGHGSEDKDNFYYSIRGSTTKVDDLGVEFLSSDEEN
jgi:hypothetical protein